MTCGLGWNLKKLEFHHNIENGSKIIAISRSLNVCSDMDAEHNLEMKKWSFAESWDFFQSKAGQHFRSPLIRPRAEAILKKCDGLALAIITVGRAMATGKEQRSGKMQSINGRNQPPASEFGYDRLDDDELKSGFLFCATFPEDYSISINEIVDYYIVEGLVDRLGEFRATLNMVHALVGGLKTSCML
ncbi:hypothetical protein AMTR_s00029p00113270 [Amborella trichopoda]|uniref:Uncharacterized protein n=1 Tax=Amborella trichopoda TaxID=13333 RepID=W1PHL4_AMBTC|nr:hypothetical protein AMTR_s00029p00113270 [Amborella trichopoda]